MLEKYPLRKKLLPSQELRRQQGMEFPVSIQRLARAPRHHEEGQPGQPGEPGQLVAFDGIEVVYEGVPEVVDFLELVEWKVLRQGMVRYSMSASQQCRLALTAPEPVLPTLGRWNDDTTPTLVLLDSLEVAGWRRGEAPEVHKHTEGKKTLKATDPVKMHAYLQCLLGLPELCLEEGCTGMRSDQSQTYYRLVVCRGALTGVPLGAKYQVYCAMMKECGQPGQLPPLEDAEEEQPEAPVRGRIVAAADIFEGPVCKRPRRQSKASSKPQAPTGRQWDELLCPGLRAQPPPPPLALQDEASGAQAAGSEGGVEAARGPVGGVAPATAAGGAASSSGDAQVSWSVVSLDSGVAAASPDAILGERMSVSGSRKILLEGVWAQYEKRDKPGKRYERIGAACGACKGTISKTWSRRPQRSPADSPVSAELFPLAYVGCWLSQCKRKGVVGSHRGWKPSAAEVEEYANQRQWV